MTPSRRSLAALSLCAACTAPPTHVPPEEIAPPHTGIPEGWRAGLPIDAPFPSRPIDWTQELLAGHRGVSGSVGGHRSEAIFELRHVDGDDVRTWYVRVHVPETRRYAIAQATVPSDDGSRDVDFFIAWAYVLVEVPESGRTPGPPRAVRITELTPGLDFTIGPGLEIDAAYEELRGGSWPDPEELADGRAAAHARPEVALLMFFDGVQDHRELSRILREVVDAPGLLSIVLRGGLRLELEAESESITGVTLPIDGVPPMEGVRFPARVLANGEPALDLVLYATRAAEPFHLTAGIVGLDAKRPNAPEQSIELRLIGAREMPRAEESDDSR
ncbi:MAG: hypothetical protein AAF726_00695 [Planctomycetota bacterium]